MLLILTNQLYYTHSLCCPLLEGYVFVEYAVLQSPFNSQTGDGLPTNRNAGKLQEKSCKTGKLTTDSSYYS